MFTYYYEERAGASDVVTETENQYVASIDLPGVSKEDINLDIDDGYLVVSAIRKSNKAKKTRYVKLYKNVDPQAITASLSDGVLSVQLPKKEKEKIKISIE